MNSENNRSLICLLIWGLLGLPAAAAGEKADPLLQRFDSSGKNWTINLYEGCTLDLKDIQTEGQAVLQIDFHLAQSSAWAEAQLDCPPLEEPERPVSFEIRAQSDCVLEMKYIDTDDSIFLRRIPMAGRFSQWEKLVIRLESLEYGWGGANEQFNGIKWISLTFSGGTGGTVWIRNLGFADPACIPTFPPAGPVLDPSRELEGFGSAQRRDKTMLPKDPLVLEYLKQLQDASSPEKQLLPSMECLQAQTFNNALVAMAFILEGEKERAERILDFYAHATDRSNTDPTLQNFYCNGKPMGFFQDVAIRDCNEGGDGDLHSGKCKVKAYHHLGKSHRWMGDMVWLLYAYKFYEKEYASARYADIMEALRTLLLSWYIEDPRGGGYIGSGWRFGDRELHEPQGHYEGNIDCYALFNLTGDYDTAVQIRCWLDRELEGRKNLPLDLYTWRVLAFGKDPSLLNIPDYDLRYRKTIEVNGRQAMGFYHTADIQIENIWLDGTGHIACAYLAYGDPYRGNFYANQLDVFLIDRVINGVKTRALPYTANQSGGYGWVYLDRGFVSVSAWYLFAKNKFNPMTLERFKKR